MVLRYFMAVDPKGLGKVTTKLQSEYFVYILYIFSIYFAS
jgi:hypothetical protein